MHIPMSLVGTMKMSPTSWKDPLQWVAYKKKMILAVDSTDTNTETAGRIEAESGSQTERLIAYLGRRTAESPSTGDPQTHMMDKCGTQPTTLTRLVKREPQKAQLPAPHSQS